MRTLSIWGSGCQLPTSRPTKRGPAEAVPPNGFPRHPAVKRVTEAPTPARAARRFTPLRTSKRHIFRSEGQLPIVDTVHNRLPVSQPPDSVEVPRTSQNHRDGLTLCVPHTTVDSPVGCQNSRAECNAHIGPVLRVRLLTMDSLAHNLAAIPRAIVRCVLLDTAESHTWNADPHCQFTRPNHPRSEGNTHNTRHRIGSSPFHSREPRRLSGCCRRYKRAYRVHAGVPGRNSRTGRFR